jgi:hypothetical protein
MFGAYQLGKFIGAAQTHVAKGAAMISDAIEDKLEDVIDRAISEHCLCARSHQARRADQMVVSAVSGRGVAGCGVL